MITSVKRLVACAAMLLPLLSQPAEAQPQAVFLNHGIISDRSTWDSAAARLGRRFGQNVNVYRVTRDWMAPITDQVSSLQHYADTTGLSQRSPVVAGHSLGGVVSRKLVRNLASDAIITIGSPHQGHPVVINRHHLEDNAALIGVSLVPVLELYDYNCPLEWYTCLDIRRLVQKAFGFLEALVLANNLVDMTSNFINDLHPSGPFISDLNGNVGNEQVAERHNVVVEAAHDQHSMGPIPMIWQDPYEAWDKFDEFMEAGFYLMEYGMMLIPEVPLAAAGMMVVGWEMLGLGDTWADALGGRPHDGFIPVASHHYPGAVRYDVLGIMHTDETRNAFFSQLIGDVARRFGAQEIGQQNPPPNNPPSNYYASIIGPEEMQPGQTCNWYVSTNLAYDTVEWRVNGTVAAYGETLWYSPAGSSFDIQVTVSGNGTSVGGSKSVNVSYGASPCAFQ